MTLGNPILSDITVIKVALETVKGTKVAGTQALLAFDLEINQAMEFVPRQGTGAEIGNDTPGVVTGRAGTCNFSIELRGTGALGMELGAAILLQACGLKKTLEVYQVHSSPADMKTISIDVWQGGRKKSLAGAMGNVTLEGEAGKRAFLRFELQGVWIAPTDEAVPANAPSTAQPMLMSGNTFTINSLAVFVMNYSLNMNNTLTPIEDHNSAGGVKYFLISQINPQITVDPQAELIADADYFGQHLAGTEVPISQKIDNGTESVTIATPKCQLMDPQEGDRGGKRALDVTFQCNKSAGNDSVTITVAA